MWKLWKLGKLNRDLLSGFLGTALLISMWVTVLFVVPAAKGQAVTPPPPDCLFFISLTTTSGSAATIDMPSAAGFDNRSLGCQFWTVNYTGTGTGSLTTLTFQAANGALVAGSFNTWAGTVDTGVNPNTSSTVGTATMSTGCESGMACNVPNAWVRLELSRGSFVGTLRGVVYGYRSGYPGGGGSGGGGGGSDVNLVEVAGNPVVTGGVNGSQGVGGLAANNGAAAGNPVLVGGLNGINVHALRQGPNFGLESAGSTSGTGDGLPATINVEVFDTAGLKIVQPVYNYKLSSDGSTWNRDYFCAFQANISLSAATDAIIVPLTSGKTTKICHVYFSSDTAAGVTFRQGTGTNCGTNTVAISGAFANVTAMALDPGAEGALLTTVAARDVCLHFSTAVTAGGFVTYAQY